MRFRFAALALSMLFANAAAVAGQADWPLSYEGKSTNQFILDKRATQLVNSRLPSALSEQVLASLGGPPDAVLIAQRRYVSVSACRPHSCDEKGFLWVDTQTGASLGAYHVPDTLLLGSNSLSADHIPPQARAALIAWLDDHDLTTTSVSFVGRDGQQQPLDAARYSDPEKFRPPPQGPSFDCQRAASNVEKIICADGALSAQDLALSQLYQRIRLGSGSTIAQEQLKTLQRDWLKARDQQCNTADCLADQYKTQYERLRNWTPTQ
ncbi:DUF1311 domain-containing protein [Duganella sp. FT80W]|uniref:DUF1311 domain-containing protein n=1 Tax=Duganella guangzhouensis TaxID=2666084 RepID=A0A6I2L377_9BURK|nr:lysozyme inhibitor LprI family protein [Duganella guangzhouensis]MRW92313.1 DUF1311 domain-containing protein [Duganella guangzhouensis]